MNTIDAKKFYNEVMPGKQGADYEYARWHKNAVASVGYEQTKASIEEALCKDKLIISILEVGPGAGTWTKLLLASYPEAQLTLLDISKEMLDRTREALPETPITYVESSFGEYVPSEAFDYLFSSRMLEYMEDKALFATQVSKLLKSGAKGCFITKYPHYLRQRLMGKTIPAFHTGQITPAELKRHFKDAGLTVTTCRAVTVSVPFFKSAFLNKWVGKLVRALPLNPLTNFMVESYLIKVFKNHDN